MSLLALSELFATVAGAVFAVKKTIIEPEEKKLAFIEENRKKATRRRVKTLIMRTRKPGFTIILLFIYD